MSTEPPSVSKPKIPWKQIRSEARERFGVTRFRPGQFELIRAALEGRDAIGLLPTGAGKSLAYQLPALFLPKPVVVVSPLLALMQDQHDKLSNAEIDTAKLDSTLSPLEQRETVAQIRHGEHDIVFVTPERLEKPEAIDALRRTGVSLFVVDEAHCISQWGHDFRPAYLALRDALRMLGRPPVMGLTATATKDVIADIQNQLTMNDPLVVSTGVERDNLFFEVFRTVNEQVKREKLEALLREEEGMGLVYTSTIREAEAIWTHLCAAGVAAELYHGKRKGAERIEAQQRFMDNGCRVMVATKAFGMGIDKPDIRFVVHWDFPDSIESYYQEAGRAGRDGAPARVVLFYRLEDRRIQAYFLGGKYPRRQESFRVYDALRAALGQTGLPPRAIAESLGLSERRVKVIAASLEASGVLERRRGKLFRRRDFPSLEALDAFLCSYEKKLEGDYSRLEAMMHYAETTECRLRYLRRYFDEPEGEDCAHCDNCRDRPAERLVAQEDKTTSAIAFVPSLHAEPAREPGEKTEPFSVGERVHHRRFGRGAVVKVEDNKVTVDFARGKTKIVEASYLSPARAALRRSA